MFNMPHSFQLQTPPNLSTFGRIFKVCNLIDYTNVSQKEQLIKCFFNSYEAEEIFQIPLCGGWLRNELV